MKKKESKRIGIVLLIFIIPFITNALIIDDTSLSTMETQMHPQNSSSNENFVISIDGYDSNSPIILDSESDTIILDIEIVNL
jgi:hypothetical protein